MNDMLTKAQLDQLNAQILDEIRGTATTTITPDILRRMLIDIVDYASKVSAGAAPVPAISGAAPLEGEIMPLISGGAQTKTSMLAEVLSNLPDNTTQLITPLLLRQTLNDMIVSYQQFASVNAQTGTSYTIVVDDYGKLVTVANASPVAVSLPQATGSFTPFSFFFRNAGVGTATITPTTSTINGAANLVVPSGNGCFIVSDGANWQAVLFVPRSVPQTFANLPPAAANLEGVIAVITDSTTVLPGTITTGGGGSNHVVMYCNGTNWVTTDIGMAIGAGQLATSTQGLAPALINGQLSVSVAGNACTASVVTLAGANPSANDPVLCALPNTSGGYNVRKFTSAASITLNSGTTLGTTSGQAFRTWWTVFDNGPGVNPVLGVIVCTTPGGLLRPSAPTYSPATPGNAARTMYAASALSNATWRFIAYTDWDGGQATAGVWATSPSRTILTNHTTPLPGQMIQTLSAGPFTQFSTSSATPVATNATISITPQMICNYIKVTFSGDLITNTSGNTAIGGFYRNGASFVGRSFSFVITGSTGVCESEVAAVAYDFPFTTLSTSYVEKLNSQNAGQTVFTGSTDFLFVEEIMG